MRARRPSLPGKMYMRAPKAEAEATIRKEEAIAVGQDATLTVRVASGLRWWYEAHVLHGSTFCPRTEKEEVLDAAARGFGEAVQGDRRRACQSRRGAAALSPVKMKRLFRKKRDVVDMSTAQAVLQL